MVKSKGELLNGALVEAEFTAVPWDERGNRERGQLDLAAAEYDKACAVERPADVLAFVAEVEASFSDVCKCGHSIPDDHCHGECEIDDCPCEGLPDLATELEQRVGQTVHLIAIVREQAEHIAEAEDRYRLANMGVVELENNIRKAWAERDALRERIAKLESLGPWIEANRLAQLQWADDADARGDVNRREQRATFEARADAFKQVGYELNNRAGKDLRKEPTNEPVG